jgi:hypothetical protein
MEQLSRDVSAKGPHIRTAVDDVTVNLGQVDDPRSTIRLP